MGNRYPVYGTPPALPGYPAGDQSGDPDAPGAAPVTLGQLNLILPNYAPLLESFQEFTPVADASVDLVGTATIQRVNLPATGNTQVRLPNGQTGQGLTVMLAWAAGLPVVTNSWAVTPASGDVIQGIAGADDGTIAAAKAAGKLAVVFSWFCLNDIWYGFRSGEF